MTGWCVEIVDQGRQLLLRQDDGRGTSARIDAATLWQHCQSALRRRQRLDGAVPNPPVDVRITRATAIGNYALNIAFSDGHDRGVYPWSLLDGLSRLPSVSDFLIALEPEPAAQRRPLPSLA